MDRLQELEELLLSLFGELELRRFLRNYPGAEAVERELPGAGASFAQVASDAVLQLDRAGLIDEAFFDALLAKRPRRKADIGRVAGLWRSVAADAPIPDASAGAAEGIGAIKILFLTANPSTETALALSREARRIKDRLLAAEHRDCFSFVREEAVSIGDLSSHLMRHRPTIVHFSGHGSRRGELLLEDARGNPEKVSADDLAALFEIFRDGIRLVVLNACYSAIQAQAIAGQIDCVVGMETAIPDAAAIEFAAKFYEALAFGRNVDEALRIGKLQVRLARAGRPAVVHLHARNGVDPASVRMLGAAPGAGG